MAAEFSTSKRILEILSRAVVGIVFVLLSPGLLLMKFTGGPDEGFVSRIAGGYVATMLFVLKSAVVLVPLSLVIYALQSLGVFFRWLKHAPGWL